MRDVDPLTQNLALWLLYLALAVAAFSQLPKVATSIRQQLSQPVTTERKVSL